MFCYYRAISDLLSCSCSQIRESLDPFHTERLIQHKLKLQDYCSCRRNINSTIDII